MKHSRKLIQVLLVLVLVVWGTIAYRIYDSINANDASDVSVRLPSGTDASRFTQKYIYVNDVRDPFRYIVPPQRDSTKKHPATKPQIVWTPPPFKLSGILMAKKKKTAMLEGTDGSVFFLHEGDTLKGMKVLKIQDRSVEYRFTKRKELLKLE